MVHPTQRDADQDQVDQQRQHADPESGARQCRYVEHVVWPAGAPAGRRRGWRRAAASLACGGALRASAGRRTAALAADDGGRGCRVAGPARRARWRCPRVLGPPDAGFAGARLTRAAACRSPRRSRTRRAAYRGGTRGPGPCRAPARSGRRPTPRAPPAKRICGLASRRQRPPSQAIATTRPKMAAQINAIHTRGMTAMPITVMQSASNTTGMSNVAMIVARTDAPGCISSVCTQRRTPSWNTAAIRT